ncbi:MAG: TolC family protein [Deltaproteobacteria bacterium]|nr:TolC family protein [Deltaproteobacteria bacterium]
MRRLRSWIRRMPAFLALGVVAFAGTPAWAGYGELSDQWESYQPEGLYRTQTAAAPAVSVKTEPAGNDEFERQKEALAQARERWSKALEQAAPSEGFYSPPAELLARYRDAADDAGVAAQALAADGITLQDLEVLTWLRNPGIRAAQDRLRGTLERYTQAWNLDEILRQYTAFTEGLMNGVGPMKGREPVQMRFPFPGLLALKGEIVTQEVRTAAEGLEIARRTAITGIRKAFWNLEFVTEAERITSEMLDLLERLESVAKARYESGKTNFQDVIQVRIRRETVTEDVQTLAEQRHTVESKIREILDLPPEAPVGHPAKLEPVRSVPELGPLYEVALDRRQELRMLRAQVGKMERMIELAETRIYPDYTLNLSVYQDEAVNQVGTARMKEPFATVTTASVGAGLPKMPWYGRGDAYVRETRQKLEALRQRLRKEEAATRFGVHDAWFRLDRAAREEALYAGKVVGLSRAALDVATRGYEAGEVMFADVIGSYMGWLGANLTEARKRADLGVAWAELAEAVGVDQRGTSR